jgi:3-deoxy-D-manno-octulosonic acid kinase
MEAITDTTLPPTDLKEIVRGPYLIGGGDKLTDAVANQMVHLMKDFPIEAPRGVLAGRGYTGIQSVEGLGRVFVKQYAHGGLLRGLTRGRFLCVGPARSRSEFCMLERVRSLGVQAPKPILYVIKGSFICQTWLVMEEIESSRNLVEVSREELASGTPGSDVICDVMERLGDQLLGLIRNKILHVDLHPGNVLVDRDGAVYIVDFDKACDFHGSTEELRDLYLRRWRRAVIKHKLSPILTEFMSLRLRSYDE